MDTTTGWPRHDLKILCATCQTRTACGLDYVTNLPVCAPCCPYGGLTDFPENLRNYDVLVLHTDNPVHSDETTRKVVAATNPRDAAIAALQALAPEEPIVRIVVGISGEKTAHLKA